MYFSVLRRDGDSNPGNPFGVYTLSRRASSTTRASLLAFGKLCYQMPRCGIKRTIAFALPTECTMLTLVGDPLKGLLRIIDYKDTKKF